MDYTENEKKLLELLFDIAESIASAQGGYMDFTACCGYMSDSDIYSLKVKLGLE